MNITADDSIDDTIIGLEDYKDETITNNEIAERISINHLLRKLFVNAEGKMSETDGWFHLILAGQIRIDYKLYFVPHPSMRKPHEKDYFKIKIGSAEYNFSGIIDLFIEDYVAGYGNFIIAAIWFYIDLRLGINKYAKI